MNTSRADGARELTEAEIAAVAGGSSAGIESAVVSAAVDAHKHLAGVKYEDITINCATNNR